MKRFNLEKRLKSLSYCSTEFIEPMECLAATKIPDDPGWVYEVAAQLGGNTSEPAIPPMPYSES